MPEHVGLYLVRNLMAIHWGCLSHRQPHWWHRGRWEGAKGGKKWEKEARVERRAWERAARKVGREDVSD